MLDQHWRLNTSCSLDGKQVSKKETCFFQIRGGYVSILCANNRFFLNICKGYCCWVPCALVVMLPAAAASAAADSPSSLALRAPCSGRTTRRSRYARPRAASAATSTASSIAASSSCWRLVLEETEPWLERRLSVAEARGREEEVEAGLPLHPRGSALLLFLCHRHRRSSTST